MNDLRKHRQLVVRDTSIKRDKRGTFLEAEQRWTFGDMATSLQAARMGFGFARYPEEKIREEVAAGELKVLPLQGGGDMYGEIYLVLADPEGAGPGIRRLAEILREDVRSESDKPRPGARKMKASVRARPRRGA
jgi:DNA-binding transcriptional LysR family regulator